MRFIIVLLRLAGIIFWLVTALYFGVIMAGLQMTIGNYTLPWWSIWVIMFSSGFLGLGLWWLSFVIKSDRFSKKYRP